MKYLILLFSLFCLSCNNQAEAPALPNDTAQQDGTLQNDTSAQLPGTSNQPEGSPEGIYRAFLPCRDCRGIEHTVMFNRNQTYKLEEVHMGKSQHIFDSGKWSLANGVVTVSAGKSSGTYNWTPDSISYHHPAGNNFRMQKLPAAIENEAWRNKAKEGLEFFGVGNEPFWNIKVDEQRSIAFHQADWTKPLNFQRVKTVRSADSIVYTAGTDITSLKVIVYPRFCNDGMSDFIYTHQVRIIYENTVFNGCGIVYE